MANLSRSVILNILGINKQAKAAIDEVNVAADKLENRDASLKIGADIKDALAKIAAITKSLDSLSLQSRAPRVSLNIDPAILEAAKLKAMLDKLQSSVTEPVVTLNIDPALVKAAEMRTMLDNISADIAKISTQKIDPKIDLNSGRVLAQIEAIKIALDSIKSRAVSLGIDTGTLGMSSVEQAFAKMKAAAANAYASVDNSARRAASGVDYLNNSLLRSFVTWGKSFSMIEQGTGTFGTFSNRVKLFAGIFEGLLPSFLKGVTYIHLIGDAIIEVAAVLIPAAVAFGAFVLAATQGVQQVTQKVKAMYVVTEATGQKVGFLGGQFKKVQNAVEPAVIQLFGDALNVVNAGSGTFTRLATGAAGVLTQLAARFVAAATSGKGLGAIIANNAVPDLKMVGEVIANVAGSIGKLLSAMPGVAQVLLKIAVGVSGFIEKVLGAISGILKFALAFHAIWLYGGLAITVISRLAAWIGATLIPSIVRGVIVVQSFIAGFLGLTAAATDAAIAEKGAMVAALASNPLVQLLAIAAAVALIAIYWHKADDGASAYISHLEHGLNNLSASNAIIKINADIGALNSKLSEARTTTVHLTNEMNSSFTQSVKSVGLAAASSAKVGAASNQQYQAGINASKQATVEFSGAIKNLTGEQDNLLKAAAILTKQGFNYAQSVGVMDLAGVKANQTFAEMVIEINGLVRGYEAMGVKGGMLQNAVAAVNLQEQQQSSKVQALTQAYSNFITLVTGSETALTTFAQGLKQQQQQAHASGASMNGLNAASMTLRGTFSQNITQATDLYNALTTQAAASGHSAKANALLSASGKDLVRSMLDQARGSKSATAQLFALAQIAGFKGPDSFKALDKWVGNSSHSMANLSSNTSKLTVMSAGLTKDVNNLTNALSGAYNKEMAIAILRSSHMQQAFQAMSNAAFKAHGAIDPQLTNAADNLIKRLLLVTHSTTVSHNEFLTFALALGLTKNQADQLWASYAKGHGITTGLNTATGESKVKFDATAHSLGITKAAADALWASETRGKTDTGNLNNIFEDFKNKIDVVHSSAGTLTSGLVEMDAKLIKNGASATQVAGYMNRLLKPALDSSSASTRDLARDAIDAADKLLKIPTHVNTTITESGTGKFVEHIAGISAGQGGNSSIVQAFNNNKLAGPTHGAKGMLVPGHGNADNVPIYATPGEAVVPKHLVPHIAPFLARNNVPGFEHAKGEGATPFVPWHHWQHMAQGGVVGAGSMPNTSAFEATQVADFAQMATANFLSNIVAANNAAYKKFQSMFILGGGPVTGGYIAIGRWLMAHGLTRAAAAGITGTIAGESGGDPEAQGSGGGGLIGWTPLGSAYPYKNIITGNRAVDLGHQLVDLMAYMAANGSVANMNSFSNPIAAADNWSRQYERPAVPLSDVRPSIVMGVYRALGGGSLVSKAPGSHAPGVGGVNVNPRRHARGGIISEPVFGVGLRTGTPMTFAENGPEMVIPHMARGGYINPLRNISGLGAGRVDMGVDYSGHGPVQALGSGVVVHTGIGGSTGWGPPNGVAPGGWVSYRLTDGPAAGRIVYVAEGIFPSVHAGEHIRAGQNIARMVAPIETGWASGIGTSTLSQTQGGAGGVTGTATGENFARLLVALGARRPTSYFSQPGRWLAGHMPRGLPEWPGALNNGDSGHSHDHHHGIAGGSSHHHHPTPPLAGGTNLAGLHDWQINMVKGFVDILTISRAMGSVKKHRAGGVISEPIFGLGLHTGVPYSFGEDGAEIIHPMSANHGMGNTTIINVMVQGDTDPDGAALRIVQKLKDYKRHKGMSTLNL